MDKWRMIFIVMAALCSGAVWGAMLQTKTEQKIRGDVPRLIRIFSEISFIGGLLNYIIEITLAIVVIFGVAGVILSLGNTCLASQNDHVIYGLTWFSGAGIAKWLRYRYWKRRSPYIDL